MARTSDTAEKTVETAWALLAEGVYPSTQAIRERIRQGSMTTINQTLKTEFWPAVARRLQHPTVPEPLAELTQQLWQQALAAADDALGAYRQAIDLRLETAEAERQAALDQQRLLQQDLNTRIKQLQQRQIDIEALQNQLAAERQTHEQTRVALVEKTEAWKTATAVLEQTTERLTAELKQEQRRSDDTEQQLTRLYEDQKSARLQLEKQLKQSQAQQHKTEAKYQQQLQTLRDQAEQAQRRAAAHQTDLAEKTAQLEALRETDTLRQNTLQKVEATLADQQTRLDRENAQRIEAELKRAEAEREVEVLTRQLDALAEKLAQRPAPAPAAAEGRSGKSDRRTSARPRKPQPAHPTKTRRVAPKPPR